MSYNFKTLELPYENGEYILTDEAIQKIRKANYLTVNFELVDRERIEGKCWVGIGIKKIVEDTEIFTVYQMPINVCGIDYFSYNWKFNSHAYIESGAKGELHPILGLVKKGAAIYFEPYPGAAQPTSLLEKHGLIGDALYWHVQIGKKRYRGLFSSCVSEPNCIGRLIKKKYNKYFYELHKAILQSA